MTFRNARRRRRMADELSSVSAVRSILERLRSALPSIIPSKESDLIKMLQAVKHISRYSASDTKRGRPSPWKRENLIQVQIRLSDILNHVSQNRIGVSTFIDHYLRILNFPADILEALERDEINLFEAAHLSRIQSGRNDLTEDEAAEKRKALLVVHLKAKLSGTRLRQRVNEILGIHQDNQGEKNQRQTLAIEEAELLEDFNPYDPAHLFWEEIKQLGFAFREIKREDLDDSLLEEFLKASEPIWGVIEKIKKQKARRFNKKLLF